MKNSTPKALRSLPLAIFLSVVAMIAVGLATIFFEYLIPGTAWAKLSEYQRINFNNPALYQSHYYLQLSQITNMQDWAIFTPISYLVGGLVFGWQIPRWGTRPKLVIAAITVPVCLSLVALGLSFIGSYVQAKVSLSPDYNMPFPTLTTHFIEMGSFQSAYWTLVYIIGSIAGDAARKSAEAKSKALTA